MAPAVPTGGDDEVAPFTLAIRAASNGRVLCEVDVCGGSRVHTVGQLKERLRQTQGEAALGDVRMHVAHAGRLLQEDEQLETLRLSPVAVLAVVRPKNAPARTQLPPLDVPHTTQRATPAANPIAAIAPRPALSLLPSRADIAAAWDRAFPSASGEAAPAEAAEEERVCRVCFCGEECGRLITPCRCRGSMRFVHAACLNEWRVSSANPRSFERCDQCGYAYRTQRTHIGLYLQSERVHSIATVVSLLLLFLLGIAVPGRPERLLYSLLRWQPGMSLPAHWGPYADAAVRGLATPAALGMAMSIQHARHRHRGLPLEQQTWAAALVLSLASDGVLVARPLLVGGLVYFAAHLAAHVRLLSRRLLTKYGERVIDLEMENVARPQAQAR